MKIIKKCPACNSSKFRRIELMKWMCGRCGYIFKQDQLDNYITNINT